ncbi:TBC1 domain, member 5 [Monosporozyma unispora]|nr:TBC1 domain, member 5 [Kazachstania unispora]
MNDPDSSFAKNFFTRPDNDDTIEQFKRQYMNSKKNYQMAMDSNNDSDLSGRFNERDIRSPPKSNRVNNEPGSVRNHNINSSRLSSTATLSADDHQDLSMLRDQVQKLINARQKDNFDKINLKSALTNLDSRLNNLENIILKSQSQTNSSRPQSYENYNQNPVYNYNNKRDEGYDHMLKTELRRNGYGNNEPHFNNHNKSNYFNTNNIPPSPPQGYSQPPMSSSQRYATSSSRYSPLPPPSSNRYYSNSYEDRGIDIRSYRNNRNYDDVSTIDLLNGKI